MEVLAARFDLRGLLQFHREVDDLAAQALWDPARLLLVGRRHVVFDHFRHVRTPYLPAVLVALPARCGRDCYCLHF